VKRTKLHGRPLISADGAGVANHAGSLLIHELADRVGLTSALSRACAPAFRDVRVHDPGVVLRDLAVMIADGGDCLSHLCVLRDQPELFDTVASDATAWRVIDRLEQVGLVTIDTARAEARRRAWAAGLQPRRITLDIDSTLVTAHSALLTLTGTENVCRVALAEGVRRFVHVSSLMVYGMALGKPAHEDFPLAPYRDPYSVTKAEGDKVVQQMIAEDHLPAEDSSWLEERGVAVYRGDICQPETPIAPTHGTEGVLHLAGTIGVWRPMEHFQAVNVTGTENVCRAALAEGVCRLVHVSSASVYRLDPGRPVDEGSPLAPFRDPYPLTKADGDKVVQRMIVRDRLPAVILRPGILFGPGDRVNFGRIADRLRAGRSIVIGSGRNALPSVCGRCGTGAHSGAGA
jgi:nucleoside-diphosphate-sugar epimerase